MNSPDEDEWPYLWAARQLRERVARMQERRQLPSVTRLADEYRISPKTVRKALRLLESEGLVYVVRNKGFYAGRRAPAP
jgi:DNA-binding GntR family transcriptional regulator